MKLSRGFTKTWRLIGYMLLGAVVAVAGADDKHAIPPARDLAADAARVRAARIPLLLMVSQTDCRYCWQLKEQVLRPMRVSGQYDDKIILREFFIDRNESIRDFSGTEITGAQLADRYEEWLTPTLLFVDAEGVELIERIRGISTIDYYGYYLDKAIVKATAALQR